MTPQAHTADFHTLPNTVRRSSREGLWMSPRDLAAWAEAQYGEGLLSWAEYKMVGFPAELHPLYNETIGALTGEKAHPDRPRDMLAWWRGRMAFVRRNRPGDWAQMAAAEHILQLLRLRADYAEQKAA